MAEEVPERTAAVYVTSDSSAWARLDVPFGLVTPPVIELYKPMAGPVLFYHASAYRLAVPEEASRG